MVELAANIWADGPFTAPYEPDKWQIRQWGTWIEGIITAFTSNGGVIYSSLALLNADLARADKTMAWVIGDPVAANNGIYGKVGASGVGSWTRRADLPFSFIIASDVGAGTANAISATTSIPVSPSALVWMNIFEANTASPVTVSFNGGTALTIKTNAGNNIAVGGLTAGMIVLGIVAGSTFRLISDQASAAIVAQAEAVLAAFERIYLGAFALAPTVDLEGNPLVVGAQYFNTASKKVFTWDGSAWITNADLAVAVPPNLVSSVQAPAITKGNQYRWSVFAFNGGETERAKGSGHATADFRSVFQTAISTGEKIDVPAWEYPMRSNTTSSHIVEVIGDIPIDVECARKTKIIIGDELHAIQGALFYLQASSVPSLTNQIPMKWTGGIIDGSQVSAPTNPGIAMIDIYQYTGPVIRDVVFYAGFGTPSGSDIGWGKIDSAIVAHNCFGGLVDNCDFTGFLDLGIYITGNNDAGAYDSIGECFVVQNSRFRRCLNGINMKRDHLGQHILNNFFYECVNGVLASPADGSTTNQGESSVIIGNRFKKMQGRPIFLITGTDYIVQGNLIVDFGKLISDGTTFTSVSAGNRIAGIGGQNISFANISDNVIRMDAWAGGTADANKEPVGIQLDNNLAAGSGGSFDNVIADNKIHNVHRTLLEQGASDRNFFKENITTQPASGTSLGHVFVGANTTFVGQTLTGSTTVDLASIAAGATSTVTVSIAGAAIGDVVVGYSISRDSSSTQFRDLDTHILVTTGAAQFIFKNNTAGALDPGNTVFTVWIKKAK